MPYLVGHARAVLLRGVDQRLVQVHHEHQLLVAVQPCVVLPAQLFGLLQQGVRLWGREVWREGDMEVRNLYKMSTVSTT